MSSRLNRPDFKLAHIVNIPVRIHITEKVAGLIEDVPIRIHPSDENAAHIVNIAVGIYIAQFAPVGSGHDSTLIHRTDRRAVRIQDITLRFGLLDLSKTIRAQDKDRAKNDQPSRKAEGVK